MREVFRLAVDCMTSRRMADSRLESRGKSSAAVGSRWVSPGDNRTCGRGGGVGREGARWGGPLGSAARVGAAVVRWEGVVYGLGILVLCWVRWLRPAAELKRQSRGMEQVAQTVL